MLVVALQALQRSVDIVKVIGLPQTQTRPQTLCLISRVAHSLQHCEQIHNCSRL